MNLEKYPRLGICGVLAWLIVVIAMASTASAEWKEKVLYSFQGGASDGSVPAGGVVFDSQGNLYGATTDGGPASCKPVGGACGAVFQLSPPVHKGDPWTETLIYQFQGKEANDGESPSGGLLIDSQGNLYGATAYGGTGNCVLLGVPAGCGTVYELSPPRQKGGEWAETILYSFPTSKQGYLPNGDLVFDSAGNLYGATTFGGTKGKTCDVFYGGQCGTAFELSPPKTNGDKWTEKVLHNFAGGSDGAEPNGGLVLDSQGAAYGTTYIGGYDCSHGNGPGCGTVFKLTSPTKKGRSWSETVLHRFKGDPDGGDPAAGLIFDQNGNLYGTTAGGGGSSYPSGTIFQVSHHVNDSWREHVLYSFHDGYDGGYPMASLVFDAEGNLYGTATLGAPVGGGTVFRLRPRTGNSWTLTPLYEFMGTPDGSYPAASLIFNKTATLFGTTQQSGFTGGVCGNHGCGTVFEVSP